MTREYEAVYIFDSALEDDAINERLGFRPVEVTPSFLLRDTR